MHANINLDTSINLQVALGNEQEKEVSWQNLLENDTSDLRDTEYNSKKVLGLKQPNPQYNVALPYGLYCIHLSSKLYFNQILISS